MANTKKEKMVKIRLPLLKNEEVQEVFVAVNGRRFKIKRGVTVEVPACVEEVLRHSEEQEYAAEVLKNAVEEKDTKEE